MERLKSSRVIKLRKKVLRGELSPAQALHELNMHLREMGEKPVALWRFVEKKIEQSRQRCTHGWLRPRGWR